MESFSMIGQAATSLYQSTLVGGAGRLVVR
jgi:hypothetical protein